MATRGDRCGKKDGGGGGGGGGDDGRGGGGDVARSEGDSSSASRFPIVGRDFDLRTR